MSLPSQTLCIIRIGHALVGSVSGHGLVGSVSGWLSDIILTLSQLILNQLILNTELDNYPIQYSVSILNWIVGHGAGGLVSQ